jgi:hypothetical protein
MKKNFYYVLLIVSFLGCTIGKGNNLKEKEYHGIIVDIYRIFNRNALTYLVKTQEYGEFEMLADSWYPSYEYAAVGDSIIKVKGELKITIKKPNGDSRTFEFWNP